MAKGAVIARIISEYSDKGTKAATKDLQNFSKHSNTFGKQFEEMGKKLAKAFAVVEIVKFGFESIKVAEAVNGAFSKMNVAFANTGSTLNSTSTEVQDLVEKMTGLAFTSAETADALARGATSFHSATTAMENMGLAADIARTTGMTLTDAMVALGKAASGKVPKSLAALGVIMPKNGTAAEKYKIITDQLTKALKGQAEAYAQTHPIEAMKAKFEELTNSLGQLLLPVFSAVVKFIDDTLIPVVVKMINFLRENPKYIQPVADAFVKLVNILAKVAAMVLETASIFTKLASVVLQVVRAVAWLAGNKGVEKWAKSAADGLGKTSQALDTGAKWLGKFHMNNVKLTATSPLVVKNLNSMTTATNSLTNSTQNLTKEQIQSAKVLAQLKKMGITPTTETDPIELEAARLNLLKQGTLEEKARIDAIIAATAAQLASNEATARYADLLTALADNKISTEEISVLASKWGISTMAVEEYVAKIYAANSTPGNDDAIMKLYEAWGLTKEEASKYIDFARALADEKLSSAEIENLMAKWGLTREQVLAYAKQVQDGIVFSSTFADPGNAAKQSWVDALAALNSYFSAYFAYSNTSPSASTGSSNISGGTSGSAGTFGGSLPQYVLDQNPELAAAVGATANRTVDIANLGSTATSGMGGGGLATTNVTVNVQGSVTSEADLISTIRQSLLNSQLSGKQITALALTL